MVACLACGQDEAAALHGEALALVLRRRERRRRGAGRERAPALAALVYVEGARDLVRRRELESTGSGS